MNEAEQGLCIHCRRRKACKYLRNGVMMLCTLCQKVIDGTNMWKQVGLEKPKKINLGLAPTDTEAFLAQYIPMVERGMSQRDIAEHWGIRESQVRSKVTRARHLGYKVPARTKPGWTTAIVPNMEKRERQPIIGRRRNEHGGGRWGIRLCTDGPDGGRCELCVERCRQTRREDYELLLLKKQQDQQGMPS